MENDIRILAEELQKMKNKYGYPKCVGCGYCCSKVTCWIGQARFGFVRKACPALTWSETGSRYYCKLVEDGLVTPELLYIGLGCPSNLNQWRKNVRKRG